MANSDPVCGETPTGIITKEKLGFGLCHNPCIYLWLRDMVFFSSGLQKGKIPVSLVLADPLLLWEKERELHSFPSTTVRTSWPSAGRWAESSARPSRQQASVFPEKRMEQTHLCLLCSGKRLFRNQGEFVRASVAKQKATKRPSTEAKIGQRIIFARTHWTGRIFLLKSFYFYSKLELSSSKPNAHCCALVFSKILHRGSALLMVQVLT